MLNDKICICFNDMFQRKGRSKKQKNDNFPALCLVQLTNIVRNGPMSSYSYHFWMSSKFFSGHITSNHKKR